MATMNVLDSAGSTVAVEKPLAPGRAAAAASRPVALSTEDAAFLDGIETLLTTIDGRVDGLETLIGSTNTKLDTLNTSITAGTVSTGTPGTPATNEVMSVQGVASGTPQPISGTVSITDISSAEYETCAVSATTVLGATGATGDYLGVLLVIPGTTSPGSVQIKDGSGSAITVFAGGASSVSNLVPFTIPLGAKSTGGAWSVILGANVTAIGIGNFT